MDGSRFDAWTRRRFGLAVGGGLASLLVMSADDDAEAKKKRKRCKKLKQGCQAGNKNKKCCKGQDLVCGEILGLGGTHCCRKVQGPCEEAGDCCGDFICDDIDGLSGTRCCGASGRSCTVVQDCCEGFACNEQTGECE